VAEAMRSASGDWKRKLNAAASGGAPITFEFLVDDYLSEAHRDHPGTGCPVSALSADIARSDKRTRAVVTAGTKEIIEFLVSLIGEPGEKDWAARSLAILTYCALLGAVATARALSDEQLSREILKTVAELLKKKVAPRYHGR
jgi:TetR/AcrR family transcriptional repressor of nem operon